LSLARPGRRLRLRRAGPLAKMCTQHSKLAISRGLAQSRDPYKSRATLRRAPMTALAQGISDRKAAVAPENGVLMY
jgi:hypothetical protein